GRADTACRAGTCWCHMVARRQVWGSRVSARQPVLGAACMPLPDTRPPLRLLALSYDWNTDHCLLVWSAALGPVLWSVSGLLAVQGPDACLPGHLLYYSCNTLHHPSR